MDLQDITCSLSGNIFLNPVVAPDGCTYERDFILDNPDIDKYIVNVTLKVIIDKLCDKNVEYAEMRYKQFNERHMVNLILSNDIPQVLKYLGNTKVISGINLNLHLDNNKLIDEKLIQMFTNDDITRLIIDKIDKPMYIISDMCRYNENNKLFDILLSKCTNADINYVSPKYSMAPINIACRNNKLYFCTTLLVRKASIELVDKYDKLPLNHAIDNLNLNMINTLINYTPNINIYNNLLIKSTVFHSKSLSKIEMTIFESLVENDININNLMKYVKDLNVVKILCNAQIIRNIKHQTALYFNKNAPIEKSDYLMCFNKAISQYEPYKL
jgi:hypothetical protein